MLNTIRQIGTVIGSAVVGAVLQNRLAAALHDEAVRRAAELPGGVRGQFVAGFESAGAGGLDVGTRQTGAALPPEAPASLAHQVQQLAASVFEHGFVQAMRPALALPVVVIAVGALSCVLVRRRHADELPSAHLFRAERRVSPE